MVIGQENETIWSSTLNAKCAKCGKKWALGCPGVGLGATLSEVFENEIKNSISLHHCRCENADQIKPRQPGAAFFDRRSVVRLYGPPYAMGQSLQNWISLGYKIVKHQGDGVTDNTITLEKMEIKSFSKEIDNA